MTVEMSCQHDEVNKLQTAKSLDPPYVHSCCCLLPHYVRLGLTNIHILVDCPFKQNVLTLFLRLRVAYKGWLLGFIVVSHTNPMLFSLRMGFEVKASAIRWRFGALDCDLCASYEFIYRGPFSSLSGAMMVSIAGGKRLQRRLVPIVFYRTDTLYFALTY